MTRILRMPQQRRSSTDARDALEMRARDPETLPRDTVRVFPTVDGALWFAAYDRAGACRLQLIAPADTSPEEGSRLIRFMEETVRRWEP